MEPIAFGQAVAEAVRVDRDLVAQALGYLSTVTAETDTSTLIRGFQESVDASPVAQYSYDERSAEESAAVVGAARSVSAGLAACEAIWRLLSRAALVPVGSSTHTYTASFGVVARRGGGSTSGGTSVPVPQLAVPARVMVPLSMVGTDDQLLASPDLYLRTMNISSLHPLAASALRDAVECFRGDLYTPAAAMLGSAGETAWTDLGVRLAQYTDGRVAADLTTDTTHFGKRLDRCLEVYQRGNGTIPSWSADRLAHLRDAALWTEQVRDSRNVLHPGWNPATPNTREKLAMLLFGATPALRAVYAVIDDLA